MRILFLYFALAIAALACSAGAVEDQHSAAISSAVAFNATLLQSVLGRADVAVAKSVITPSMLRGEVGEAIRNLRVSRYHDGKWVDIYARLGPQGLDHVSVQLDRNGFVNRLMVDESKFGSANLSRTVRGDIQMGDRWVAVRLAKLADRYAVIARASALGSIRSARIPSDLSYKRILPVPLSESESVRFWRPVMMADTWLYDGPAEALPRAMEQVERIELQLRNASIGKVSYPKRIFQVKPDGKSLAITIRDATAVDAVGGDVTRLPIIASISGAASDLPTIESKFADEIRRQMPHLDRAEAQRLARGAVESAQSMEKLLSRRTFFAYSAAQSVKVGGALAMLALPLETASTLIAGGTLDWARTGGMTGLAGASGLTGNVLGDAVAYSLLRNPYGYSASSRMAEVTGLRSPGRFARITGGTVGGGATGLLLAYGGYWLGYYDIGTANLSAVAGVAGAGVGAAFSAIALELTAAYGVAGSGVAISSLGGIAATNASLAWLGGGTLASGGFGVFGGTVVLGTGVGVVLVGTSAAVFYVFHLLDEQQDDERLSKMLAYLVSKYSV